MTQAISTGTFCEAKWVVDPTAGQGTHTTIQAAITAAAAAGGSQTVFIRPGSYTENLTLSASVNLAAFNGDQTTPNVTIVGKATFTAAGTVSISSIRLQTNSDFLLAVTGSAASIVNLNNCYLNCTNNTGISYTSSSSSSQINLNNCLGDVGTTGIALFSMSSTGNLFIIYSAITNSGASLTANTASAGILTIRYSRLTNPVTSSSTNTIDAITHSIINTSGQNVTSLTSGGSSTTINHSNFLSGTASAISISTTLTISSSEINSTNTNSITGVGTINYEGLNFIQSSNINTTTQNILNNGPSLQVGSTNSGNTNSLTVTNSSNTASSSSALISSVGGTSAGDAVHQSVVSGTTTWTWGIDNSVTSPTADPWVLSQGTTLGTNNVMSVATSGEINYPLQPSFLATANAQSNVTGDGTAYTILYANEIFDQNSDFSSPTFTAPVTGKYQINSTLDIGGFTASHTTGNIAIVASNRTVQINNYNWGAVMNVSTIVKACGSILMDMDAADTCTITATISNGTKVVGIDGTNTTFSAYLVC